MKIVTVVGARPQFIKAATISRALRDRGDVVEVLVHTGQHYDSNMSDVFFEELEIPRPDYHLGVHGGSHGAMTGKMLEKIEEVLLVEKPDWLLVYGDTNSTLAAALAASKLHIPIAHIEAGLRSFNRRMPEEVNRVLTDHVSSLLFAPTKRAVKNLMSEGIPSAAIREVGDVMLDAALYYADKAEGISEIFGTVGLARNEYLLATIHRSENTDDASKLSEIVRSINYAATQLEVVLPLHPRTRNAISLLDADAQLSSSIKVIDPVGYLDMVMLEKYARIILTDSGGVQKEAYFYKTPCITLRDETEWVELVECHWNKLVGSDHEKCKAALAFTLSNQSLPDWIPDLYGIGDAARTIASQIFSESV